MVYKEGRLCTKDSLPSGWGLCSAAAAEAAAAASGMTAAAAAAPAAAALSLRDLRADAALVVEVLP